MAVFGGRVTVRRAPGAPPWVIALFLKDERPERDTEEAGAYCRAAFLSGQDAMRRLWLAHAAEIVGLWARAHPGHAGRRRGGGGRRRGYGRTWPGIVWSAGRFTMRSTTRGCRLRWRFCATARCGRSSLKLSFCGGSSCSCRARSRRCRRRHSTRKPSRSTTGSTVRRTWPERGVASRTGWAVPVGARRSGPCGFRRLRAAVQPNRGRLWRSSTRRPRGSSRWISSSGRVVPPPVLLHRLLRSVWGEFDASTPAMVRRYSAG